MNLSDTAAMIRIGSHVKPPSNSGDTRGLTFIGREVALKFPDAKAVWSERLIMANGAEADVLFQSGEVTPETEGSYQEEQATVTGYATSSGNLGVVVTGSGITGSPLTVQVPLTTADHGTGTLVAEAIAAALNATAALTDAYWVFRTATNYVIADRVFPMAGDATFNIALPGALGITAAASSTTVVTGAAGVKLERLGTPGGDVYGQNMEPCDGVLAYFLSVPLDSPAAVSTTQFNLVKPGDCVQLLSPAGATLTTDTVTAAGNALCDIIVIAK